MKCGHFLNLNIENFYKFRPNLDKSWYNVITISEMPHDNHINRHFWNFDHIISRFVIKISEMPHDNHINRPLSKKWKFYTYLSRFDTVLFFERPLHLLAILLIIIFSIAKLIGKNWCSSNTFKCFCGQKLHLHHILPYIDYFSLIINCNFERTMSKK